MRQQIFTLKESRIRLDLEFTTCDRWLRSADSDGSYYTGYVYDWGDVYSVDAYSYYGVLPACTI